MVELERDKAVLDVKDVKTSMKVIFEILREVNLVKIIPLESKMQLNDSNFAKKM